MRTSLSLLALLCLAAPLAACGDDDGGGDTGFAERDVDTVRPPFDASAGDASDASAEDVGSDAPPSDAAADGEDTNDDDAEAGEAGDALGDSSDDADSDGDDVADVADVEDGDEDTLVPPPIDVIDDTDVEEEVLPEPDDMIYQDFTCPQRWGDSPIRIIEVMIDPNNSEGQESATEWFEIANVGSARFELAGVEVRDDDNDSIIVNGADRQEYEGFYQDPARTYIEPGQILPFYQRVEGDVDCRDGTDPDCKLYLGDHFYVFRRDDGVAIGNSADEIVLEDPLGRILDCIRYQGADVEEGLSWQRLENEAGTDYTNEWCLTYPNERRRYNDNGEGDLPGDYGTPGARNRCW